MLHISTDCELQRIKTRDAGTGVCAVHSCGLCCGCVHGPKAKTPGTDSFSNRELGHVHQVPLHFNVFCYKDALLHPLHFHLFFFSFKHRLDSLSVILPWYPLLFVSVSAAPFILLSFNCPLGNGESSLQKAKAGTSLPVYIKDLSFKATGTTVKGKESETAGIEIERDSQEEVKTENFA